MVKAWKKWPEEQRQNILRDYQAGTGLRVLESRYHHHWTTIRAFLRDEGIVTRGVVRGERFCQCPEATKKAIWDDYQRGIAIWRLSIKYHYPQYSIARFLKSQGANIHRRPRRWHVRTTSGLRTFAERLAFAIDHCSRPLTALEIGAVMQSVHNDNRRRNVNLAEEEVAGA